jgi:hypothetical protein
MIERKCPICGDVIIGRVDKKYCGDQCRATANKGKRSSWEGAILDTNRNLRKNRTILKTLCPHGKAVVRKEVLDAMQFDYGLFTDIYLTRQKQIYYYCYDFGFMPILEKGIQKVLIVTKRPHIEEWDPWRIVL